VTGSSFKTLFPTEGNLPKFTGSMQHHAAGFSPLRGPVP
jgi:hypothetical protein